MYYSMNNYDQLYDVFQQAKSKRERQNFNALMDGIESGLIHDLNKAWLEDKEEYEKILNNIKKAGIRVFRNEDGKHKLKFI